MINVLLNPIVHLKTIVVRKKRSLPRNSAVRRPKPLLPWQTGEYQRHLTLRLAVPQQLLLLCKLMDVTPRQLVADFMENLAGESPIREKPNAPGEKLMDYFLEQQYGQDKYSREHIIVIFRELNAISMLYPLGADNLFVDFHAEWRERYQAYWFEKWRTKTKTQTPSHLPG